MRKITAQQFREEQAKTKKRNKYGAQKVVVQGIEFDSKREANRFLVLRQRERDGEIRDLKLQVPIMLEGQKGPMLTRTGKQMRITVDFSYIEVATGLTIYDDAKGEPSRDYEVRKSAVQAMGYTIRES